MGDMLKIIHKPFVRCLRSARNPPERTRQNDLSGWPFGTGGLKITFMAGVQSISRPLSRPFDSG